MKTLGLLVLLAALVPAAHAYPLYGSEDTGIRRLEEARLAHEGVIPGKKRFPGELLSAEQVKLTLLRQPNFELPAADSAFTAEVRALLGGNADRYGVCVLDLSDLDGARYAEHNGDFRHNPGSVGKVVVATAVFQALADLYPDDLDRRRALLRDTVVVADEFIISDSHTVRIWNPERRELVRRPPQVGDRASLYEWLDWMLSASANAAASMLIKHALLLVHFGHDYPVSEERATRFFAETPKAELGRLLARTLQEPLIRNGLDPEDFRQGSLFTRTGKQRVPGTTSRATCRGMLKWLLRLEQGRLVDPFSSLEIKRLLYVTERRIRYASSPALHEAAVYFKSGSWYQCEPEEGFVCKKYHGNKLNLMNSIAIVESPAGDPRHYYLVALMSNVLRKNSAVDHQTLATRIHRLIEAAHPAAE